MRVAFFCTRTLAVNYTAYFIDGFFVFCNVIPNFFVTFAVEGKVFLMVLVGRR